MRTLYIGTRGPDVSNLQYFLGIKVDGIFGPMTETAVKTKQGETGLSKDGSVGPRTQAKWGLSDFRVHIYDREDVWFAGTPYSAPYKPLKTLDVWAEEEQAHFVYNLAFFNMSGTGNDQFGVIKGRTLTYLKAKGVDVGYGGTLERLTIDEKNICSGYKVAIKDGVAKSVSLLGKRCRNADGILADGRYFHVQSVTTSTEAAIRDFMLKNFQVKLMLIQDSGGSTGFYDRARKVLLAGEREGLKGRPVASVVCIGKQSPIRVCECCGQRI